MKEKKKIYLILILTGIVTALALSSAHAFFVPFFKPGNPYSPPEKTFIGDLVVDNKTPLWWLWKFAQKRYTRITGNLIIAKTNLTNLNNFQWVCQVEGDVHIFGNKYLKNIWALERLEEVGGNLTIGGVSNHYSNGDLYTLEGLENLTFVGGDVNIINNDKLVSLSGLDSLASIGGDLWITHNDSLYCIDGMISLDSFDNELHIYRNPMLCQVYVYDFVESLGRRRYGEGDVGLNDWDCDERDAITDDLIIFATCISDQYSVSVEQNTPMVGIEVRHRNVRNTRYSF